MLIATTTVQVPRTAPRILLSSKKPIRTVFDERGNAGPVLRTLIVAGEESVLAIEHNGANASFDEVDVEFDAAVIEETGEPVSVQHLLADARDLWRITPKGRRSRFNYAYCDLGCAWWETTSH